MKRQNAPFLCLVILLAGCSRSESQSGSPALEPSALPQVLQGSAGSATVLKPTPPLALKRPDAPLSQFHEHDLSELDSATLAGSALQLSNAGEYDNAVQLQYWSVANSKESSGQYNLACFCSLAGNVDASLYWLQEAAEKQGVDAGYALEDSDLANARRDPRWAEVSRFLQQYNDYWKTSDHHEISLIVPAGYKVGTPIPLVIGLHGMGSRATGFVTEGFQTWADELNVAFVGVSGTIPRGPSSFVWSEEPIKDQQRLLDAIDEVRDRVTPKDGTLVLFGFSQGAMMAAEIAARRPDMFCGALVMSPGGNGWPMTSMVSAVSQHQQQGYVIVCGAQEAPGNVMMAKLYADQLGILKSRIIHKPYDGMSAHAFPPDFAEMFGKWIQFIQDPAAKNAP